MIFEISNKKENSKFHKNNPKETSTDKNINNINKEGTKNFSENIFFKDKNHETLYKEDKFFITRSMINKNTQINISKVFFPENYKKKSNKNSEKPNSSEKNDKNLSSNKDEKKKPSIKKIFLNTNKKILLSSEAKVEAYIDKGIKKKKQLPPVKSNLTVSLNSELARISTIYGKEASFKKFTDNPITNKLYEERNFLGYEMAKINELRDLNVKPKLKPLKLIRESPMKKLTESIFHIKEIETDGIDINEAL